MKSFKHLSFLGPRQAAPLAAVACAVALAACGGGGNDATPPGPTEAVPATATQSVGGLVSYLQALIASDADTAMPVDLSAIASLPVDDTADPALLN